MEEVIMYRANENAYDGNREHWFNEKALFVSNLGWLLSQTREGVTACTLITENDVAILFDDGYIKHVNITADSFVSIIRDVARAVC